MNREYLGRTIKKGTFLCRCTKDGDFEIGKNAIEENNSFLRNYKLPISPTRTYDPCNVVRNALKQAWRYNFPPTKGLWEEDVIAYFLDENIYKERVIKFRDVMSFE